MSLSPDQVRQATAEGAIRVARCADCGSEQAMPADTCFACGGERLATAPHAGGGRLYSWVRTALAFDPKYAAEVPYTVLVVALDGGARVYGRLAADDEGRAALADGLRMTLDPAATRAKGCPVFKVA